MAHVKKEPGYSQDYFLASKSLPWWAVGGSLIAANISAEQFVGMSVQGLWLDWRSRLMNSWPHWPS
jgi:SSS family solute:Na+ symporter